MQRCVTFIELVAPAVTTSCCVQEVKVAALDTTSSGTLPLSLKVWQEGRAAKTGRGASDMQEGPCSASYRCFYPALRIVSIHCTITSLVQ